MSRRIADPVRPELFGTSEADFPKHPDLAGRAAFELEHHVALAWVFDADRTSVLLVEHRTMSWSCPGGHIDPGERLVDAAIRELAEETGLTAEADSDAPVTLGRSIGCARYPNMSTVHWAAGFLFTADPTVTLRPEPDARACWFAADNLPSGRVDEIDVVAARFLVDR